MKKVYDELPKEMLEMKLHDKLQILDENKKLISEVLRVPGGFLYIVNETPVYIAYNQAANEMYQKSLDAQDELMSKLKGESGLLPSKTHQGAEILDDELSDKIFTEYFGDKPDK